MQKVIISILTVLLALAVHAQPMSVADSTGVTASFAASPAELLKGGLSGVRVSSYDGNINGAYNVSIRGINSLRSDNQPLWIVDGVMLGNGTNSNLDAFWQKDIYGENSYTPGINQLAFLSAYDIESIQVLKDASATAIYGSRGANGVVIINTKVGSARERSISLNSNVGYGHNHHIAINGEGNTVAYNVSGFYRDTRGSLASSAADYGGVKLNIRTSAGKIFHFGFNSMFSMGKVSSPSSTAWFTHPSMSMAHRDESLSPGTDVQQWDEGHDDDAKEYRFVNSANLRVNFMDGLYWETSLGADYQNINRNLWYGDQTEFGKDFERAASALNSTLLDYNVRSVLNFNRYFARKHHLTAIVGAEATGKMYRFNTFSASGFMTDELRGNSFAIMSSDARPQKFTQNHYMEGGFVRTSYDYESKAGLAVSVRADVTRKYHDWTPYIYPSVEAYVDVREVLFPSRKGVSVLKIKSGYGVSGNEMYVPYEKSEHYLTGEYLKLDKDAAVYCDGINIINSSEWHISAEAGFWNDRIALSATWYDRSTYDIFAFYMFGEKGKTLWNWSERKLEYSRSASMRNRGIESDVAVRVIEHRNCTLTFRGNVTYNINEITGISKDDASGKEVGNGLIATSNVLSFAASSISGHSPHPKMFGSFRTTLYLYGVTADFRIDASGGNSILNLNRMAADKTSVVSEKYIEKGDFARLSQVSLSYRLPLNIPFIKSISLRLTSRNLFTITDYSGYDPDVNSYGLSVLSSGMDYGSYPLRREVTGGINIIF